jgi:hypothetical protein
VNRGGGCIQHRIGARGLPRCYLREGLGRRMSAQDRGKVGDAAPGLVSVQVALALPETHGLRLALWQADQTFIVIEV